MLTASSRFLDTLDNIVKGLNKAGFSSKDFKVAETVVAESFDSAQGDNNVLNELTQAPQLVFDEKGASTVDDIDASRILDITLEIKDEPILLEIEQTALKQEQEYEETILQLESTQSISLPSELQSLVKTYKMKGVFAEQASQIQLPQFFIKKPSGEIFSDDEHLLNEEDLLEGFQLSKCDSNIAFDSVTSELYKVDLDETKSDYTPSFVKLDGGVRDKLMEYILDPSRKESRAKNLTAQIMDIIGNMYPITEH